MHIHHIQFLSTFCNGCGVARFHNEVQTTYIVLQRNVSYGASRECMGQTDVFAIGPPSVNSHLK